MKRLLALIATSLLAALSSHASSASAPSVPQWTITELSLTAARPYANPYQDVIVTATFTGPQNQSLTREAFWCGGDRWKIRFAPTATGRWTWTTASTTPADPGLHARSGEFTCAPYTGDLPLYRHGFLRVSDDHRHFTYADGTPFFWLGDTHWLMPNKERVDTCNHPEHGTAPCPHGGQFQHLLSDRLAKGFNVYQTYPSAASPDWWTTPFTTLNPERFDRVFDVQMNELARHGVVIALGFGHFGESTKIPVDDLRRWARYLVARYGAHPVIWITCQEMNAPEKDQKNNRIDVWRTVAAEIPLADAYRRPHSAHQWVVDVKTRPLGNEPWHTWFALQGGHLNTKLTTQGRYQGYYDFKPTRPVLETEAMYEAVDCGGIASADDARRSAWNALLNGCAGYTYGGGGVWALKWDAADPSLKVYNHPIDSWHAGMVLPGSAQMTHVKTFFESLPWTTLVPRFTDAAWATWTEPKTSILATAGNDLYLAYVFGKTSQGVLKKLDPTAPYKARWFNPRTGNYEGSPVTLRAPEGTCSIPEKPDGQDWVFVLEKSR